MTKTTVVTVVTVVAVMTVAVIAIPTAAMRVIVTVVDNPNAVEVSVNTKRAAGPLDPTEEDIVILRAKTLKMATGMIRNAEAGERMYNIERNGGTQEAKTQKMITDATRNAAAGAKMIVTNVIIEIRGAHEGINDQEMKIAGMNPLVLRNRTRT